MVRPEGGGRDRGEGENALCQKLSSFFAESLIMSKRTCMAHSGGGKNHSHTLHLEQDPLQWVMTAMDDYEEDEITKVLNMMGKVRASDIQTVKKCFADSGLPNETKQFVASMVMKLENYPGFMESGFMPSEIEKMKQIFDDMAVVDEDEEYPCVFCIDEGRRAVGAMAARPCNWICVTNVNCNENGEPKCVVIPYPMLPSIYKQLLPLGGAPDICGMTTLWHSSEVPWYNAEFRRRYLQQRSFRDNDVVQQLSWTFLESLGGLAKEQMATLEKAAPPRVRWHIIFKD